MHKELTSKFTVPATGNKFFFHHTGSNHGLNYFC